LDQFAAGNTKHDIEMIPLGEAAIIVEFGRCIHPDIHRQVKAFADYLDIHPFPGMIEYVSAFSSVTVFYDPLIVRKLPVENLNDIMPQSYQIVAALLHNLLANVDVTVKQHPRVVEIPVCYGGEFGPDLEYVAEHNQLSVAEVIEIHTGGQYLVYMIGFAPGFPYLGGMSERIMAPRRQSPRLAIPAGTVGIAGMQTGVYPIETPGGWQLIGRTPLALFRPKDNPPSLLQSGDIVRFCQISDKEYAEYKEEDQ
jgi:inhibitor of KinA